MVVIVHPTIAVERHHLLNNPQSEGGLTFGRFVFDVQYSHTVHSQIERCGIKGDPRGNALERFFGSFLAV
jgi:hypothetical protein